MIKVMASIVYNNKPYVVRRDSKFLSAGILREGISFAIAMSHRDCLKRTDPVVGGRLDHKIDGYIEMAQQSFAPILANVIELFKQSGRSMGKVAALMTDTREKYAFSTCILPLNVSHVRARGASFLSSAVWFPNGSLGHSSAGAGSTKPT
jgi:hypothetical protein